MDWKKCSDLFFATVSEAMEHNSVLNFQNHVYLALNAFKRFRSVKGLSAKVTDVNNFVKCVIKLLRLMEIYSNKYGDTHTRELVTATVATILHIILEIRLGHSVITQFNYVVAAIVDSARNTTGMCAREFLGIFTVCAKLTQRSVLDWAANNHKEAYLKLHGLVHMISDVQYQYAIMEVIVILYYNEAAGTDFSLPVPKQQGINQVLKNVPGSKYKVLRRILEMYNRTSKRIFSIICEGVVLWSTDRSLNLSELKDKKITESWLDFDLVERKVLFFLPKSCLNHITSKVIEDDFAVLRLELEEIVNVDFTFWEFDSTIEVSLDIKMGPSNLFYEDSAKTLTRIVVSISESAVGQAKFTDEILPEFFPNRFKVLSQMTIQHSLTHSSTTDIENMYKSEREESRPGLSHFISDTQDANVNGPIYTRSPMAIIVDDDDDDDDVIFVKEEVPTVNGPSNVEQVFPFDQNRLQGRKISAVTVTDDEDLVMEIRERVSRCVMNISVKADNIIDLTETEEDPKVKPVKKITAANLTNRGILNMSMSTVSVGTSLVRRSGDQEVLDNIPEKDVRKKVSTMAEGRGGSVILTGNSCQVLDNSLVTEDSQTSEFKVKRWLDSLSVYPADVPRFRKGRSQHEHVFVSPRVENQVVSDQVLDLSVDKSERTGNTHQKVSSMLADVTVHSTSSGLGRRKISRIPSYEEVFGGPSEQINKTKVSTVSKDAVTDDRRKVSRIHEDSGVQADQSPSRENIMDIEEDMPLKRIAEQLTKGPPRENIMDIEEDMPLKRIAEQLTKGPPRQNIMDIEEDMPLKRIAEQLTRGPPRGNIDFEEDMPLKRIAEQLTKGGEKTIENTKKASEDITPIKVLRPIIVRRDLFDKISIVDDVSKDAPMHVKENKENEAPADSSLQESTGQSPDDICLLQRLEMVNALKQRNRINTEHSYAVITPETTYEANIVSTPGELETSKSGGLNMNLTWQSQNNGIYSPHDVRSEDGDILFEDCNIETENVSPLPVPVCGTSKSVDNMLSDVFVSQNPSQNLPIVLTPLLTQELVGILQEPNVPKEVSAVLRHNAESEEILDKIIPVYSPTCEPSIVKQILLVSPANSIDSNLERPQNRRNLPKPLDHVLLFKGRSNTKRTQLENLKNNLSQSLEEIVSNKTAEKEVSDKNRPILTTFTSESSPSATEQVSLESPVNTNTSSVKKRQYRKKLSKSSEPVLNAPPQPREQPNTSKVSVCKVNLKTRRSKKQTQLQKSTEYCNQKVNRKQKLLPQSSEPADSKRGQSKGMLDANSNLLDAISACEESVQESRVEMSQPKLKGLSPEAEKSPSTLDKSKQNHEDEISIVPEPLDPAPSKSRQSNDMLDTNSNFLNAISACEENVDESRVDISKPKRKRLSPEARKSPAKLKKSPPKFKIISESPPTVKDPPLKFKIVRVPSIAEKSPGTRRSPNSDDPNYGFDQLMSRLTDYNNEVQRPNTSDLTALTDSNSIAEKEADKSFKKALYNPCDTTFITQMETERKTEQLEQNLLGPSKLPDDATVFKRAQQAFLNICAREEQKKKQLADSKPKPQKQRTPKNSTAKTASTRKRKSTKSIQISAETSTLKVLSTDISPLEEPFGVAVNKNVQTRKRKSSAKSVNIISNILLPSNSSARIVDDFVDSGVKFLVQGCRLANLQGASTPKIQRIQKLLEKF